MQRTSASDGKDKAPRVARVFRNGRNQAVRLPKDYEIDSDEVLIRKHGADIILTPRSKTWDDYFAAAHRLGDNFPDDIEDLPLDIREDL